MGVRNIIKIDEEKCTGCGHCVEACKEGAIELVDGKAKLVREDYCDGLGACIGHCPAGAITIERRQAADFDEQAVQAHLAEESKQQDEFVCPGLAAKLSQESEDNSEDESNTSRSQLRHWPVQLRLVPVKAPYFAEAELVVVADCVPFAMGDFHERFLQGRSVVVGCPKLDDAKTHIEKLTEILRHNRLKGLTVVHMEVPCCSGLVRIVEEAIRDSGVAVPFCKVTISVRGEVLKVEHIELSGR